MLQAGNLHENKTEPKVKVKVYLRVIVSQNKRGLELRLYPKGMRNTQAAADIKLVVR
jgi:hypothetical protein